MFNLNEISNITLRFLNEDHEDFFVKNVKISILYTNELIINGIFLIIILDSDMVYLMTDIDAPTTEYIDHDFDPSLKDGDEFKFYIKSDKPTSFILNIIVKLNL